MRRGEERVESLTLLPANRSGGSGASREASESPTLQSSIYEGRYNSYTRFAPFFAPFPLSARPRALATEAGNAIECRLSIHLTDGINSRNVLCRDVNIQ